MPPIVKTIDIPEPKTQEIYEEKKPEEYHGKIFKPEEQPVDSFEAENQHLLLLDCFGIRPIDYIGDEATKEKIEAVDKFIKEEIQINHYKTNIKTYKRVLEGIKKKVGITQDFEIDAVLERLFGFIKAYNKIKEGQDEKFRRETLRELFKSIKKKDFNSEEMELRLVEDYLKERDWNGQNTSR